MTVDNRLNIVLCAAAFAVLLSWSGCDGADNGTDGFAFTAEREAGAFTLVSVEPIVFTGQGNPTNFELLADVHFEAFGANESAQGASADHRWRQMSGGPEAFRVVAGGDGDGTGLTLHPDPKGLELRQSTADLGPLTANMWLVATMRAKTDTPYALGLVISYEDGVGRIEAAEGHPGDGQWHDVSLVMPVPADMTKHQYDCSIVYLGNANKEALVAWTQMRVESRDDVEHQTNLVVNGDFERYGFTQPPYPWKLDRWNSKRQSIVGGDAVLVAASGSADGVAAMSFTRPGESTNVRISQRILTVTSENTGAKLVASAVGLASHNQELWLRLRCQKKGRDVSGQSAFAIHPGNGQWHDLSVELTIPPETVADTVYVDAFRRSLSDSDAIIDSIRVERN